MSAAEQVSVPIFDAVPVRRFETPDLSRHGGWLLARLLLAFPHHNERSMANFLNSIMYNNEYLFLCQEQGVALAQIMTAHTLSGKPVIHERFVWVKDKDDKEQQKKAALFYDEFHRWAKGNGADVIIVEEMSDVPHDMIKERLGRIFTRQQVFARV